MVLTDEYMKAKLKISKEHRDVSRLEGLKYELSRLQGWMEQIREDGKEDEEYEGWNREDINDFIDALGTCWSKLDKEAQELYKKYGLEA